ncbi:MAG: hypothetical protein E2577_11005, partial [Starkeya sp.]|nr:hypothetical protein [Starkeya sp.]
YGVYFYGDAYGFAGGPVTGVSFTDVEVIASGSSAVYVYGPITNVNGNVTTENVPSQCTAPTSVWTRTRLTQTDGSIFSIDGETVPTGTLTANCGI